MTYAALGIAGIVPWRTSPESTAASGVWLLLAGLVLFLGTRRIRHAAYATSRRNAHRVLFSAPILVDGVQGELVDISVGGAAVRFPRGTLPALGLVELELPGSGAVKMSMSRMPSQTDEHELASLQAVAGDWAAIAAMSLWLFHTPNDAVPGLPAGMPAVAVRHG